MAEDGAHGLSWNDVEGWAAAVIWTVGAGWPRRTELKLVPSVWNHRAHWWEQFGFLTHRVPIGGAAANYPSCGFGRATDPSQPSSAPSGCWEASKRGWDLADVFPGGASNWGGAFVSVPETSEHKEEAAKLDGSAPEQQVNELIERRVRRGDRSTGRGCRGRIQGSNPRRVGETEQANKLSSRYQRQLLATVPGESNKMRVSSSNTGLGELIPTE
ncbi:hypothetical protein QBC39DRAFT_399467 [Podospora conica]|nr:hypothetical protein QBC39DRAFT_399467 [Schizothecium conicum]